MFKGLFLILGLIQLVSCGQSTTTSSQTTADEVKVDGAEIVKKMKPYCESCHVNGTEKKKFFISKDDPAAVWKFITTTKNPDGVLWVDAIVKTLEWPSNEVPAADAKNSDGKKFMPAGATKRAAIAKVNDQTKTSDREWILKAIKEIKK